MLSFLAVGMGLLVIIVIALITVTAWRLSQIDSRLPVDPLWQQSSEEMEIDENDAD